MAAATPSFLDRPVARVVALLCFALSVSALAYVHRDDLFPSTPVAAAPADDPVAACIADRTAEIDRMRSEGLLTEAQAVSSRARLDGVCRAQTGVAAPAMPPLPQ